jgi:hypothetical protein
MLDTYTIRQDEMPLEMRFLFDQYPRDSWDAHPGFREKTKHWLGAHQMFRRVAERIRLDTEGLLNKDMGLDDFAPRLSHHGGNLVGNLHGHHGWEDHSFFPELSAADPRFDTGLEVLEQDHADLDKVLDDFTRSANRLIKLATLDATQAYDEAEQVLKASETIEGFLKRHLSDEEELAVPIILHHRLRG